MLHVGTGGWQQASWKGRLYPKDVPQGRWLENYAKRFTAVEVNNLFHITHIRGSWTRPPSSTFCRNGAWRSRRPGL